MTLEQGQYVVVIVAGVMLAGVGIAYACVQLDVWLARRARAKASRDW